MDNSDDSEPLLVDDGGDDDEGGAPPSLLCPITQEVMVEPVIASDGFTYERSAIERWLDMGPDRRSPTTNAPLPSRTLVPNRHLASMIAAYRSRLGARVVALVGAERELPAPADWESRERALLGEVGPHGHRTRASEPHVCTRPHMLRGPSPTHSHTVTTIHRRKFYLRLHLAHR